MLLLFEWLTHSSKTNQLHCSAFWTCFCEPNLLKKHPSLSSGPPFSAHFRSWVFFSRCRSVRFGCGSSWNIRTNHHQIRYYIKECISVFVTNKHSLFNNFAVSSWRALCTLVLLSFAVSVSLTARQVGTNLRAIERSCNSTSIGKLWQWPRCGLSPME